MACLTFTVRSRRRAHSSPRRGQEWGAFFRTDACDGDTLALAARQLRPALAPPPMSYPSVLERMKSLAAAARGGGGGGAAASMHLVIGRAFAAEPDVLFDRAVEQAGILEHRRDLVAQRRARRAQRVDPIDADLSPTAGHRHAESRLISVVLPAPVGPTIATVLPAGTWNEDVFDTLPGAGKPVAHILEGHVAAQGGEGPLDLEDAPTGSFRSCAASSMAKKGSSRALRFECLVDETQSIWSRPPDEKRGKSRETRRCCRGSVRHAGRGIAPMIRTTIMEMVGREALQGAGERPPVQAPGTATPARSSVSCLSVSVSRAITAVSSAGLRCC